MNELATVAEINAYFEEIMNHHFLTSGRVEYFPICKYVGDNTFISMTSERTYKVKVNKRIVDATYLKTSVPSTHTPNFSIEENVPFVPLNDLPEIKKAYNKYVVIGGGKTGIDACLWLLQNHVEPEQIKWIMPRDAWLMDRKNTQPTEEFFFDTIGAQANQMEAIAQASSIDDLFERLEQKGVLVRIDTSIKPEMYHGATISQQELTALRKITDVVRKGRITHLADGEITLTKGKELLPENTLYIDCSASALGELAPLPVFNEQTITLQTIRVIQPVFSAALIAHIEATYENDQHKNMLSQVVPLPNHANDWLKVTAALMKNQYIWSQDESLQQWIYHNRLDGFSKLAASVAPDDEEKQAVLMKLRSNAKPAMAKLTMLLQGMAQQKEVAHA